MAIAAAVLVTTLGGDDDQGDTLTSSQPNGYTMQYPSNWRALPAAELENLSPQPLALIRRKDGEGLVIIREAGRAPGDFTSFTSQLTKRLDGRLPDFQKRTSRRVKIRAGRALFYSYIRRDKGTVNTIVLVPAGKRSYTINTVSGGRAKDAAREIATMILSFDVPH